jgi:hypothetical protein
VTRPDIGSVVLYLAVTADGVARSAQAVVTGFASDDPHAVDLTVMPRNGEPFRVEGIQPGLFPRAVKGHYPVIGCYSFNEIDERFENCRHARVRPPPRRALRDD